MKEVIIFRREKMFKIELRKWDEFSKEDVKVAISVIRGKFRGGDILGVK